MINQKLVEYIESKIIPQYKAYDGAHQPDHVYQVIENSLDIAKNYNVNLDIVYAIAAYHDIGLKFGRQGHESASRKIIEADFILKTIFNDNEIKTIAQAAEDHRASLPYEPRSLYGKIISEADRDINFERLLSRTILYSLDHYPDYVKEDTFEQVYAHMIEKYGPSGRIKLWLEYEPNVENLKKVHATLADETAFRKAFEPLYSKYKQN
ncbi:HD domain-containing protein [Aerococcaceae bacterium INB8]|uniref:HD domain-containing protein n=1 Tax=Ruoffia halotolerans TaxID=2748684 RepID=A0A839A5C5_9LACT|nr:HD domain-containing protein [Ruoffia halotolerans]MBA5728958.1 HD domain-containing protein [Ruoffia halotolerans]